jgi:RHS repeat-associated protein
MKISLTNCWLVSALLLLPLPTVLGQVGNNNPTGPAGDFNGEVTTGCSYDPYTGNAKRTITDLVVPGAVGKYGLTYSRTWNSRFGAWSHSFNWAIADVYKPQSQAMYYGVSFPDGRVVRFTAPNYTPGAIRERFRPAGALAYLVLPDGGKIEFNVQYTYIPPSPPDGLPAYDSYHFTVNAIIDPYGQRTIYTYNTDGSTTITEPAGRCIQIFYRTDGQVDHIQSSDGRRVDYTYSTQTFPPGTTPYNVLTSVRYYSDPSLVATYTYDKPNVGSPNGTPVLKTCDDPMYGGPMKKISYTYATGVNPDGSAVVYGQILSENSGTTGQAVSTLSVSLQTRTETRGDGKTRTFTYDIYGFLSGATDFKGVAQTQTYDAKKWVNSVTDRNGRTTNYTNDTISGLVTLVQYPSTPGDTPSGTPRGSANYIYGTCPSGPNNCDDINYLSSIIDEGGNTTTYTRDPNNKQITRVDYQDGGSETFGYNSFGQVTSHLMKTGGTETWEYDVGNGRLLKYRDPYHASGNPSAWYQYDNRGRVSGITDALGSGSRDVNHTTAFTYNERGQLLTTTYPPDGYGQPATVVTNVYNPDGTLASVTDQLGHVTTYTYDFYRRGRTVVTPQRFAGDTTPRTTSFSYALNQGTGDDYTHTDSNVTLLTLPSGNIVKTHYDENYRKDWVQASAADGVTDTAKTSYQYDNAGNLKYVTAPNQQPSGPKTTYNYDERNRPMSIVDALNNTTTFTYDAAGRKKTVTRASGQVTTFDLYDGMNRLLQQTVKQTPDPDAVTKYTYYTSGLLNTMQDPRLVALNSPYKYAYAYDSMGRKTSLTYPPDSGNVQRAEAWSYDGAGRVGTFTNRDSKVQTFSYDALNRQKSFTWNDSLTPSVSFAYDAANRLTSVTNTNATVTRTYFNDNLLNTETETPAGQPARTITYGYTADGTRASVQYPGNAYSFAYGYTGRDQLQTIAPLPSGTPIASYGYDLNGNLKSRGLSNSTSSTLGYDALNRAFSVSHVLNGTTRTFVYGYDAVGNRKWTKRDGGTGDVFGYDLNDEVTASKLNIANPDTTAVGAQTINYDANGNRTSFAAFDPTDSRNGSSDTYSESNNSLNQYGSRTNSATHVQSNASYDTKGNLTTGVDGSSYSYDAQNRLLIASKSGNTFTFKYDGLNRQVSRTLNGGAPTYNVWDGWQLIEDVQSGSVTAAYLSGAGSLVKNLVSGNYYYQDASGSTSHLANSTGQLLEWYRYDLQGTPVFYNSLNFQLSASNYSIRHLFTGQQWYSNIGLYDLRNRFYSPDIGRFLQADPIGFGGDPGNIYRYCGNNPVNRSDPSGLQELDEKPVLVDGSYPGDILLWGGTPMSPRDYGLDPAISFGPGQIIGSFVLPNPLGGLGAKPVFPGLTLPPLSPQPITSPNVGLPDVPQTSSNNSISVAGSTVTENASKAAEAVSTIAGAASLTAIVAGITLKDYQINQAAKSQLQSGETAYYQNIMTTIFSGFLQQDVWVQLKKDQNGNIETTYVIFPPRG